MKKIDLKSTASKLENYYSPKVIGEVNDVFVKVAKAKGDDIPWHSHKDEDELFYVIDGELLFEVEEQPAFTLKKGELFIVPRGVNHRVSAEEECTIMLIENKTTAHTGDVITDITKSVDDQFE